MPLLNARKGWKNGIKSDISHLDNWVSDVETFFNTTLLDSVNFQNGGISTANIPNAAITTAKTASSAGTTAKFNDNAVTQAKKEDLGQQSGSAITRSSFSNSEFTISTTGRPVMITIQPVTGSSSAYSYLSPTISDTSLVTSLTINRINTVDATSEIVAITRWVCTRETNDSGDIQLIGAINHIDTPDSGEWKYQAIAGAGIAEDGSVTNYKLMAYEIN